MTEVFDIWPDNSMYQTLETAGYGTDVVGLLDISKEEIYALPPCPANPHCYYPAILHSTLSCWRSFLSYREFNGFSVHPLDYLTVTHAEYKAYVAVVKLLPSQIFETTFSSSKQRMHSPTKSKSPTAIKCAVDELFSTYAVQSPPAQPIIQQDSTVDPPYGEVAPVTPSCEQVCTVDPPSMGSSTTVDLDQLEKTVGIEPTIDEPPSVFTDNIANTPTLNIRGSGSSQAWNTISIDSSIDLKIAKVMATIPSPSLPGQPLLGCPPDHTGRGSPLLGRPPDLLHLGHGFPPPGRPPGIIQPTSNTNDPHLSSTNICTSSQSTTLRMQLSSSYVHIYKLNSQASVHPASLFRDTHSDCTSPVYIYCYHQFHLPVQDLSTSLQTNDTLLVIPSILLKSDTITTQYSRSSPIQ
jgi:hypothetical protein